MRRALAENPPSRPATGKLPDDSAGAGPCALVSAVYGLLGVLLQHSNHVRAADVSAIKRWAELLMVAGSLIALALATLVISRAINIA